MNKILILTRKELTEILRDKKTLIMMIVMPLILYPLLLIGMTLGISMLAQSQMDKTHVIAYDLDDEKYIKELTQIYEDNIDDMDYIIEFRATDDEADARIDFTEENGVISVNVSYTSTDENSDYAEEGLNSLVELYREKLLGANLENKGLSQEFLYPVVYESTDSATVSESVGMSLGGSVGMILIVMIMMGAFYPAVDVTTGEKERGTLETLLTLPVSNFQMIMSKYIAVSVMACITAIVSIIALGGSVLFMMFGLPSEYVGEIGQIPLGAFVSGIPVLLLAVIATALLITAVSMSFCIFAKSSKEANNYMTPVMLIVMIASMAGIIPTINLDYKTSLIPIVNVSLLVKQILAQQLNPALAGTTILVNAGCSVIAIWIIARIYDSEDVLFNDGFHSFKLFQKRSEIKKGTVPETGDIVLCLAVLLILMIYISVIVGTRSLFVGTVVTQLAILILPIVLTWYMKSDIKTLFCIKPTRLRNFITCIFIYIGTFLLVNVLSVILASIFAESTENLEVSYGELMNHPFIMVAVVMAVMPAVGEELLFRGLVLGSFKHKYGARTAIIVTSLIFGAYHMSLVKFIPTALLGMCLAYAVEKSGSIFVSMFLHFINNFISVLVMKYPDFIGEIMPFLTKESYMSAELVLMFIIAVFALIVGVAVAKNEK
jgi:sodium transport system permease protein